MWFAYSLLLFGICCDGFSCCLFVGWLACGIWCGGWLFVVGLACVNSVAYMDVMLNWLGVCGLGVVMFALILLLRVGWGWCLVGWIGLVVGVLVGCLT